MEFHPSQLPVLKTFEIRDEFQVSDVVTEVIKIGFSNHQNAIKVLFTNEREQAKKIGFLVMNEVNFGLRKTKQERDVRYWIYHEDKTHFAMVLIGSKALHELGY